jgi:hypothetical protein
MFQPINSLPLYNPKTKHDLKKRWDTQQGLADYAKILAIIKNSTEDVFISKMLQEYKFKTMEYYGDFRGLDFWTKQITSPQNFIFGEAINYSYARWIDSIFTRVDFGCNLSFSHLQNCSFKNCSFKYFDCYGAIFEACHFQNCDFLKTTSFVNCKFIGCKFENPFIDTILFIDCSFDNTTTFSKNLENIRANDHYNESPVFHQRELPEIFKSIKNGYLAGDVYKQYRKYYFLQKKFERIFCKSLSEKAVSLTQEIITGYGVRPQNIFVVSMVTVALFSWFYTMDSHTTLNPWLMSFSAFTTIGNIPLTFPFDFLFVLEGILGIGFGALFITVLANIWFSEK